MTVLSVTVNEDGVLRVDIMVPDQNNYFKAMNFHQTIGTAIAEFDLAIKKKLQECKGNRKEEAN